eukprot:750079-Hanusia_phi.AAC.3
MRDLGSAEEGSREQGRRGAWSEGEEERRGAWSGGEEERRRGKEGWQCERQSPALMTLTKTLSLLRLSAGQQKAVERGQHTVKALLRT